ncbi:HAD family hydrolase [Leifsonia naganoensis]|uniref:Putative hydrolase of the HAD superfamily n=1 Tax=Leifsonia naganoensis TaxID=150025 RepID=A0A853DXA8_9MICO|nr:HAD family hydrolase [Leifsonia naganoensis]NYK11481.1 putative hydrolase of the HAD superfamily [Leifsonia naganoensis]
MIRVVLFDLDGVIRHFDPAHAVDIEERHGLAAGTLESIAFAKPLIDDVTTGRISRAEWLCQVGDTVGSAAAVAEWGRQPTVVDETVLELSDELRSLGLRTAVLTNGTDTIRAEIAAMGIGDLFDAFFNSAEIGFVKPDVRAFRHVLDALAVGAEDVFFTDDSASKLEGADSLSIRTHLFAGVDDLRGHLRQAGVDVALHGSESIRASGRRLGR